mmetsp:Transcript_418/g.497  ORF Transcript_418/g.497 Transcript_418/m.497 type:complete len:240 (-) Transcript_418:622-1341(-)
MVSIPANLFITVNAVLTVLTFLVSYILTYAVLELESYPYYYISSSINNTPTSNIGALLLSPAAICVPCIAYVRYSHVNFVAGRKSAANRNALIVAILSCIGGLGVAAFPASADFMTHIVFAGLFFVMAWVYLVINVYIDRKVPEAAVQVSKLLRIVIVTLSGGFFFSLIALWWFRLREVERYDDSDYPFVAALSYLEIGLCATVLSVYLTFLFEFKHLRISLKVTGLTKNETRKDGEAQ